MKSSSMCQSAVSMKSPTVSAAEERQANPDDRAGFDQAPVRRQPPADGRTRSHTSWAIQTAPSASHADPVGQHLGEGSPPHQVTAVGDLERRELAREGLRDDQGRVVFGCHPVREGDSVSDLPYDMPSGLIAAMKPGATPSSG